MKKIGIFLLAWCLLSIGCVRQQDVDITGIGGVELALPSAMSLTVGVENRSARTFSLRECRLEVGYRGSKVMTVMLPEPVKVAGGFAGQVKVSLRLSVNDFIGVLAIAGADLKDIAVSGRIVVGTGLLRKKIVLHNRPLSEIMSTFGLKSLDIKSLF